VLGTAPIHTGNAHTHSYRAEPQKALSLNLSDVDCAWIAGILEGEGHFRLAAQRDRKHPGVACEMTDEDVISKIHILTGMGHVSCRERGGRKRLYLWRVTKRVDVVSLLKRIRPYMGERRGARIDELLKYDLDNPITIGLPVPHGTYNSYQNKGCRCDDCRAASSCYQKRRYLAAKAARIRSSESVPG
jgi:hypothetical protein